jgi:hypothetical protein
MGLHGLLQGELYLLPLFGNNRRIMEVNHMGPKNLADNSTIRLVSSRNMVGGT